jgi:type II secretory pathway component PulL
VLSRLDLVVVAAVACGVIWIEHEHRVNVMPTAEEAAVSEASACPDNDSIPFSADCIAFIRGGVSPAVRAWAGAAITASAASPDTQAHAELHAPACPPSNENGPYSARCLRFLSGWFWHPERAP